MSTLPHNARDQVKSTGVSFQGDILTVQLSDGRTVSIALDQTDWLRWLWQATPQQRANWSIEPRGFAIYWEDLDDGIELSHLLSLRPVN